ncbi:MAG TPA: type II toxin-antitoxin system VapC family toxin [Acidobacteriota bacterium]|nr:type II toxin-antitoxin system VapC family toxin [Acidobacteriota bacterium]
MTIYIDSSALIKLYVKEAGSTKVADYVKGLAAPIIFSHLHEVEIKNGLRLKLFRKETSRFTVEASIRLIDEDLASGILERRNLQWLDVFRKAEEFSRDHSAYLGCRALDLLHIACAALLEATHLLTFDARQAELAKRAGLKLIEL